MMAVWRHSKTNGDGRGRRKKTDRKNRTWSSSNTAEFLLVKPLMQETAADHISYDLKMPLNEGEQRRRWFRKDKVQKQTWANTFFYCVKYQHNDWTAFWSCKNLIWTFQCHTTVLCRMPAKDLVCQKCQDVTTSGHILQRADQHAFPAVVTHNPHCSWSYITELLRAQEDDSKFKNFVKKFSFSCGLLVMSVSRVCLTYVPTVC